MTTLLHDIFEQSVDYLSQHDVFYGHGVELPEDEVVLLLMFVLDLDFEALNEHANQPIGTAQVLQIQKLLEQRVSQKIPMVYVVGFAVFAGLKFKVDERVLIPRSPFVELIDSGFEPWLDLTHSAHVLDMCTGSGCIGLATAHYFTGCTVDLVDLSAGALQLAAQNMQNLGLAGRVKCIESDLFTAIDSKTTQPYDLVIANPPYVAEAEYQNLPTEYTHEPKMALVSASEGLEIPVKILLQAPEYMAAEGYLFLEVGYNDELLSHHLPKVQFEWLEFELGGQGICVFSRHDLLKYRAEFKEFLKSHVA